MTAVPTRQLLIIRIALISGVGLFAALTAWLRSSGQIPAAPAELLAQLAVMRSVVWGLAVAAVGVALIIRGQLDALSEAAERRRLIIGWSVGEGVALFGVVQFYQGGLRVTMAVGVLAFAAVLLILPIPRTRS